ncbi:Nucleoside-diphosphate-sugar epimerase [Micractinium conductrix]|uniref:Nucleoside-diphosphate-sugar epimerase n=1 Tax=Micractinium conductrix TaxID=554055 RepID=A0A2P6VMK4_9CHLO|nr:Nucleoside-diphosphate-sugar epimerase [Micractinium conductrix]|eukprot:PSC75336.1 Nucleoside-diphosphate-sugar epimerase [Micractinium conductrix]
MKVFVTGAGGRTGKLVLERLRDQPGIEVKGLVRRQEQQQELGESAVVGDVLEPAGWEGELAGSDALVILTSAVTKMRPTANPDDPPEWYFEPGQMPEQVDWEGQRTQIDLAKKHGVKQVVLISSMGTTKPAHPLNRIGGGNILFWKNMAAEYLVNSGVAYTIIHPGGLIDQPGGRRQLLVGKRDSFMDVPGGPRTVPRADVAEAVVQALLLPDALNKSFDLVSRPEGEGEPTRDFAALFDQTTAGL